MERVSSVGGYLEKFGWHEFRRDKTGRWVTSKGRRLLLSLLTGTAISLLAAPRLSHAMPIDEGLTIQPIIVCDSPGDCATPAFDLPTMQTVLNLVWAQAGIAPELLQPEEVIVPVNVGGSGALQVGVTTGADNTIPVDGFRSLTRTLGNGQVLSNPNTINLYLNDTLSPFVNGNPQSNTIVRGVSFINGNGIEISSNAVLDTVAHELGHVLGLDHATPDNNPINPANLMTAPPQGTRIIPTSMNQIGVSTDLLSQVQIDRARQPLFTVGLGRVTSTPFSSDSCNGTCFEVAFAANPSVTETLNNVIFKYGPGVSVNEFDLLNDPASAFNGPPTFTLNPNTNEITLAVSFLPGAFGQGDILDFGTNCSGCDVPPPDPTSVIFNFTDGFVSQAGFDSVTGAGADSGLGSFSFCKDQGPDGCLIQGTPNYYIPGTCPTDPVTGMPSCFFGSSPTFGETIDFDPVPEPSALVMLSTGVVGLWFARRRRSPAIPYLKAIPE